MAQPMRQFNRQRGAVAVIVGLAIALLVGMVGLVLDLGRLYIAKTELQNAADAAALAGAKELNGSLAGVLSAGVRAIEAGGKNKFEFAGTTVVLTNANLWVGSCPDDTCMVPIGNVSSEAAAADKTFLKVDTGVKSFDTWFFHAIVALPGLVGAPPSSTGTFGMAVAGRYTIQITPMAVCAIDKTRPELGFLRGVAYNLPDLNPINNGDPIWINPVDLYPGPCDPNHGNVGTLVPFVCTGRSSTITSLPGEVWVNVGANAVLNAALNSRFDDPTAYTGGNACDPATAPADTNVKEFFCTRAGNPNRDNFCPVNPGTNAPQGWMDPINTSGQLIPYHQTIETFGAPKQGKPFNWPTRASPESAANFSRYGALWSYSREIKDFATRPYTTYNTSDWPALYGGAVDGYPTNSPYVDYVQAPTGQGAANATPRRRVLNIAIIDCEGVTDIAGQNCRQHLPVLAVGQFFMQRRAALPQNISGEFAGIVAPPLPPAEIRLYR